MSLDRAPAARIGRTLGAVGLGRAVRSSVRTSSRSSFDAGDTYQVNYTYRIRTHLQSDPFALFLQLATAQTPAVRGVRRYRRLGDLQRLARALLSSRRRSASNRVP